MIVSSPYRRAVETIEEFAVLKNLSISAIKDFRERRVDSGWIE